jgi:hypothetical protein
MAQPGPKYEGNLIEVPIRVWDLEFKAFATIIRVRVCKMTI